MFSRPNLGSINQIVSLSGKKAIITGAANGIGEAISLRLGESGASLILLDIDKKGLTKLQANLMERDVDATIHQIDLGNKQEIDDLWSNIRADILVNNAGIYPFKDFLELDSEFYDYVMRVNLD